MSKPPKLQTWNPAGTLSQVAPTPGVVASFWRPADTLLKVVFIAFILLFALLETRFLLRLEPSSGWAWAEALFLVSAVASALCALAKRLPLQNVVMAGFLLFSFSTIVAMLGVATGIPFGPIVYGEAAGPRWFGAVPWMVPFVWVLLVVNGRGVARLILRPWRKTNYYGFWVMGVTGLLAVHFAFALEPFAIKVGHYWLWRPTQTSLQYYTAPWVHFLAVFATTVILLGLTLPWLVNKQPVKRPMDYQPLLQWLLLHAWLATGNALHGLWAPCMISLAGCLVLTAYAFRGARW